MKQMPLAYFSGSIYIYVEQDNDIHLEVHKPYAYLRPPNDSRMQKSMEPEHVHCGVAIWCLHLQLVPLT